MARKHVYFATIALALLLLAAFFVGRITAPRDMAVVTSAALADTSGCRAYTGSNEIYLVRWIVKNTVSGICVKPDSDCARTAYVGGTVPRTCRDQHE